MTRRSAAILILAERENSFPRPLRLGFWPSQDPASRFGNGVSTHRRQPVRIASHTSRCMESGIAVLDTDALASRTAMPASRTRSRRDAAPAGEPLRAPDGAGWHAIRRVPPTLLRGLLAASGQKISRSILAGPVSARRATEPLPGPAVPVRLRHNCWPWLSAPVVRKLECRRLGARDPNHGRPGSPPPVRALRVYKVVSATHLALENALLVSPRQTSIVPAAVNTASCNFPSILVTFLLPPLRPRHKSGWKQKNLRNDEEK